MGSDCVMVVSVAFALVGAGIPWLDGSVAFGAEKSSEVRPQTPLPKTATPQIPAFAERSKIPAFGKQGPPGKAATIIGNRKQGEILYAANCQSCHGPEGH